VQPSGLEHLRELLKQEQQSRADLLQNNGLQRLTGAQFGEALEDVLHASGARVAFRQGAQPIEDVARIEGVGCANACHHVFNRIACSPRGAHQARYFAPVRVMFMSS